MRLNNSITSWEWKTARKWVSRSSGLLANGERQHSIQSGRLAVQTEGREAVIRSAASRSTNSSGLITKCVVPECDRRSTDAGHAVGEARFNASSQGKTSATAPDPNTRAIRHLEGCVPNDYRPLE